MACSYQWPSKYLLLPSGMWVGCEKCHRGSVGGGQRGLAAAQVRYPQDQPQGGVPDGLLGQNTYAKPGGGYQASNMQFPRGVVGTNAPQGGLLVADYGNNRVVA